MLSRVSSPMLEIRNVFPFIFPYPPSMEIFLCSRKVLTKPARSISRLFLTQVKDLEAYCFFGKKLKAFVSDPVVNHLVELGMPGMPVFHSFIKNLLQGMVEGVNKRNNRGARRHPFFVILAKFEKVEIVASPFDFLGAFESSFGDGQKS